MLRQVTHFLINIDTLPNTHTHILPLHPIHAAAGELKALDAAAGALKGAPLLVLQHYLFCWYKSTNSECEWLGQIQKLTSTCCTYCTLPADARIPGTSYTLYSLY
jgi:hypothetical protein